ncbi:MAG: hypothetical protein ACPLPS_03140, partial [bacterium]
GIQPQIPLFPSLRGFPQGSRSILTFALLSVIARQSKTRLLRRFAPRNDGGMDCFAIARNYGRG